MVDKNLFDYNEMDWSEVKKTALEKEWREFNFSEYFQNDQTLISEYLRRTVNASPVQIDNFWFDIRNSRRDFQEALDISLPENNVVQSQESFSFPTNNEEDEISVDLRKLINDEYDDDYVPNIKFNKMNLKKEIKQSEEEKELLSTEETLKEFGYSKSELEEKLMENFFTPVRSIQDFKQHKENLLLKKEEEKRIEAYTTLKGNTPEILTAIKKFTTPPAETKSLKWKGFSLEKNCDANFLIPNLGLGPKESYVLVAPPFTGKSFFATHLMLSIISGKKFLGQFEVARTGKVAWLDYDSCEDERCKQILRVAAGMGINMEEYDDCIEYANPSWRFNDAFAEQKLTQICKGRAFCVIDTISGSFNGDENAPEYGKIVEMANKVSKATECTIMFLAHTPKGWKYNGTNGDSAIRGSGSVLGTAGGNWILEREKESNLCNLICHKNRKLKFDNFDYTYRDEGRFLPGVGCYEKVIMEYKGVAQGDCSGPNEDITEKVKVFEMIKMSKVDMNKKAIVKEMNGSTNSRYENLQGWIDDGLLEIKQVGSSKFVVITSFGEQFLKDIEQKKKEEKEKAEKEIIGAQSW